MKKVSVYQIDETQRSENLMTICQKKAAKITGMTTSTIRKWCARYDVRLLAQSDCKKKKPVEDFRLLANKDIFQAKTINIENALSRRWSLQPNIYR